MIDVSGDIIYFDNRPVGFITIPSGTMRDRLIEALESVGDTQELDDLQRTLSDAEMDRDAAEYKVESALKYAENSNEPEIDKIIELLS